MRVFICDDDANDRQILKNYFSTYAREHNIEYTIFEFSSGESLVTNYTESSQEPDILFLDILMGELSGIEVANQLLHSGFTGGLIFTTISRDYAVEGFSIGVDGYLCKPYNYENFCIFVQRCHDKFQTAYKTLTILSHRKEFRILLHKILYIESCAHGSIIHAEGNAIKTRTFLSSLESKLANEPCFIRCGRSYLININAVQIDAMQSEFVQLKNGEQILIPIRERTRVYNMISDYYWRKIRETEWLYG